MEPLVIVVAALVVALLLTVALKIVPIGHVFVTERLGKHQTILEPGVHFIVPAVDSVRARLDIREQPFSKTREPVITRGDWVVLMDVDLFYQIIDPRAAVYEVADYAQALDRLTVTTLRNMIGGMDLPEALASRAVTNAELRRVLNWTTGKWGIRVNRVEVTAMDPSSSVHGHGGADTGRAR